MTLADLSGALGKSGSAGQLSRYELGKTVPNLETLQRIAAALGVPLSIARGDGFGNLSGAVDFGPTPLTNGGQ
jgi:transcriptional regulator with XRE-family HTH domain